MADALYLIGVGAIAASLYLTSGVHGALLAVGAGAIVAALIVGYSEQDGS